MPVLQAKGEAEALCAQLNSEGHVDACITADSDAFLFGAKCIIKRFCPNSKVSYYGNCIFFFISWQFIIKNMMYVFLAHVCIFQMPFSKWFH